LHLLHLHEFNAMAGEFLFNTSPYISLVYNAHVIIARGVHYLFFQEQRKLIARVCFFLSIFSSFCRQAVLLGGTVGNDNTYRVSILTYLRDILVQGTFIRFCFNIFAKYGTIRVHIFHIHKYRAR